MPEIITGQQSANVQDQIIDKLLADFTADPTKDYYLLIPNHIKFNTEVKVLEKLSQLQNKPDVSAKNIQVLSFSRLAWFLEKDRTEKNLPILTDTTATMILKKVVKEHTSELTLFHNNDVNQGMLQQIYVAINELENNDLDLDDFFQVENANLDLETAAKIHDLKIIFAAFQEETRAKFITKNQATQNFNEFLLSDQAKDLRSAKFYVSDFSYFTPLELATLKVLTQKSADITFGFKLGSIDQEIDYDLVTRRVITQLTKFMDQHDISYNFKSTSTSKVSEEVKNLNEAWVNHSPHNSSALAVMKADSRYDEAYFVARTIYQQVAARNKKYRYRDFLVVAPNLSEYETYLGPIFASMGIPYFNDLQKEMKYHQLVLLLESLHELLKRPLSQSAIIQLLKTGLFVPSGFEPNEITVLTDNLENFILKYGLDHQKLKTNFVTIFDNVVLTPEELTSYQRLEDFKNATITAIEKLLQDFKNTTDTSVAIARLYQFFTDNQVLQMLESERNRANEAGDLQLAQEPEQVLSTLSQLLQDYLLINPTDFDGNDFFEILKSGFAVANFAQIPSTLDAVTISELGMIQSQDYQQQFIIGATSGDLPDNQVSPKFFNQENIIAINDQLDENNQLEDTANLNQLNERSLFGNNLTNAKEKIYLSYPQISSDNKQLNPSDYLTELVKLTNANVSNQSDLPNLNEQNLLEFITTPQNSLGYLLYLNQNLPSDQIQRLINLTNSYLPQDQKEQLQQAFKFTNQPQALTPDLATGLFGQRLLLSISQLESYYKNPYDYFLNYGLRLKKRAENDFDSLQTGSYYHEIFDRFVKALNQEQIDVSTLTEENTLAILRGIEKSMKESSQYKFLLNNPKNQYLANRLDQTANIVMMMWVEKINQTPLRPTNSEVTFGPGTDLAGPTFTLDDHQIAVRGKIDRIDATTIDSKTIAQVVDYKSSNHKFDFNSFYNGLQMQMLTYLEVLKNNPKFFGTGQVYPFGAFYQSISANPVSYKKLTQGEQKDGNYLAAFNKQLQLDGLVVDERFALDHVVSDLDNNFKLYASIKEKKDGTISLPKNHVLPSDLAKLFNFNDHLIKNAGHKIYQGLFPLAPYKIGTENGLMYSDYKDILYFDVMLKDNEYREIKKLSNDDVMKKITEDLNELD